MKYFLSVNGQLFGYAKTIEEAENALIHLSASVSYLKIVEFDDKVIPIRRIRMEVCERQRKSESNKFCRESIKEAVKAISVSNGFLQTIFN